MSPLTLFGVAAVSAMLVFYALERRSPVFILYFAAACLASSIYGFLQGAWPFGVVEAVWTGVALNRWRDTRGSSVPGTQTGPPLACGRHTFTPAERGRYDELRARLMDAMTGVSETPHGFALRVASSISLVDIGEWISLERRCCPFLTIGLTAEPADFVSIDLRGGPGVRAFLEKEFAFNVGRR